ncbi:MAG: 5-oxoprolinase subunit B family protein [Paracoccaceae bacterium]
MTPATPPLPRLLDCGECALSVEFGDRIDDALNARVLALDAALTAQPPAGLLETVPTYRSLMLHYDPLVLSRDALGRHVARALDNVTKGRDARQGAHGRLWRLPACYDPSVANDLGWVAAATGLTPEKAVRLHAAAIYRVVMYGFAPGWSYLSGLPAALTLPRRATPRDRIPAGSLIVAGGQAIVAALPMPSGWHIIGRTPVRLFDPARSPVFLVEPGDRMAFDPVDLHTLAALETRAAAGEVLARPGEG